MYWNNATPAEMWSPRGFADQWLPLQEAVLALGGQVFTPHFISMETHGDTVHI